MSELMKIDDLEGKMISFQETILRGMERNQEQTSMLGDKLNEL